MLDGTQSTDREKNMKITVASGKGGTGKTTFSSNLAWVLAQRGVDVSLIDCDVEEPNSNLFMQTELTEQAAVNVPKPVWDEERCRDCGECVAACKYNALALVKGRLLIFNELCHGCGACSFACPTGALREAPFRIGTVASTDGSAQPFFVEGRQNVGETLAPAVVRAAQAKAKEGATNICDAAPGTACPVVAAVEGGEVVVMVTEPTPFGLHDLALALELALDIGRPVGIVINRSEGEDALIADFAAEHGIPILGRIPFARAYAETYSRGGLIAAEHSELRPIFESIYAEIERIAALPPPPNSIGEEILPDDEDSAAFAAGAAGQAREIVVLSGKGGTGKTTVLASLAQLAGNAVLADGDVDASDLHLLLPPRVRERGEFKGNRKALIDAEACIGCGACADICHFDAIREIESAGPGRKFAVETAACEGCELCPRICPVDAISMRENINGRWFISRTPAGPMAHARLGAGEENSGRLVTLVRQQAARLARELRRPYVLIDGPPGTSCPAIAAVTDADLALIVTEPTVSGVHDLERVLELCGHFGVPARIVINKSTLNPGQVERIRALASAHGAPVVAELPFDRAVHQALLAGQTPVAYGAGPVSAKLEELWGVIDAAGAAR
jgi:MinD superfamily P-loop ATPase